MSRCFPYPPPGYSLSRPTNEALIESIKLQKVKEIPKELHKEKSHKEKSREDKEKRREKKEKKKEKEKRKEKKEKSSDQKPPKSDIAKIDNSERFAGELKAQFLLKKSESVAEQLERSSLTEERGQPVTPALPSTSSDSTQNSNKRKRENQNPSPSDVSRGHGNIIRIRLASKKPKLDVPALEEKKACPEIVRAALPIQTEEVKVSESTSNRTSIGQQFAASRSDGDQQICSTSKQIPVQQFSALKSDKVQQISTISQQFSAPRSDKDKQIATTSQQIPVPVKPRKLSSAEKEEIKYKNLFENWSPPELQLQGEFLEPDLDWLLQGKKVSLNSEKKWRTDEISCSNSYAMQPRAQFIKEADIYALPFTVPF